MGKAKVWSAISGKWRPTSKKFRSTESKMTARVQTRITNFQLLVIVFFRKNIIVYWWLTDLEKETNNRFGCFLHTDTWDTDIERRDETILTSKKSLPGKTKFE